MMAQVVDASYNYSAGCALQVTRVLINSGQL